MDFVSFRRALHIIHSGSVLDVEIIPGNNMNRLQYMDRATRECILLMLSPERHEPASPWVPKMAHPLCKHKSKQMLIKTCTWASEMRTCFLVNPRRPGEHFEHVHVLSDGQLHARPRQKKQKELTVVLELYTCQPWGFRALRRAGFRTCALAHKVHRM